MSKNHMYAVGGVLTAVFTLRGIDRGGFDQILRAVGVSGSPVQSQWASVIQRFGSPV